MRRLRRTALSVCWLAAVALASPAAVAQSAFRFAVERIELAGHTLTGLSLSCGELRRSAKGFDCRSGYAGWQGKRWPLRFSLSDDARRIDIEWTGPPGRPGEAAERWRIAARPGGAVRLRIENGRIERLGEWAAILLPDLAPEWQPLSPGGRFAGQLLISGGAASGELRFSAARFANAAGTQAGENLAGEWVFALRRQKGGWEGHSTLRWSSGELYSAPFFLTGNGQRLALSGRRQASELRLDSVRLDWPGLGALDGQARWKGGGAWPASGELRSDRIELAQGGALLLKPWLASRAWPEATLTGGAALRFLWRDGEPAELGVVLDEASLALPGDRFALTGVSGRLDWAADGGHTARLAVTGARLAGLPVGPFALPLHVDADGLRLPHAELPLLDAHLLLDDWRLQRSAAGWRWSGGLALTPLALPLLSEALGLPKLAGTLSLSVPRIEHQDNTLALDGAAVIQAFDGFMSITGLRLIDPFGRLPRLSGDVEVRHLDLGMLTDTYSFGHIAGFIDADIRGLEMSGRTPLRFDARIESSPGRYAKRISQRAVGNLGALGGGGTGVLQGSALRFFEDFGYERIALSCRLEGAVCTLGGSEDASGKLIIVQGGGIPALTIVGYNRRVNWPELVDRLQGAIRNNLKAEIR